MNVQIVLVGSDTWLKSLRRCWSCIRIKPGRRKHNKAISIELELKRLVWFGMFMSILLYLGIGFGAYLLRARQPYNQISYADVLMAPINAKGLVQKQGETQILQARDDLANGQVMQAFYKYRSGVRRVPEDFDARLELAQFYIAAGLYVEAVDLLIEGLDYKYPEKSVYLTSLIQLCQYTENNPAIMRAAPKILNYPEIEDNQPLKLALLKLLLRAQIIEQDYANAITTADHLNEVDPNAHYHDTITFAYLKMGAYEDARQYLNTLDAETLSEPQLTLMQGYLAQSQEDEAKARKIYHSLFRDHPQAWNAQMDAIILMYANGDTAAADALLDLYLAVHRRNMQAITSIAAQFTDQPDSQKVKRLMRIVGLESPDLFGALWFYYIQALVTEGKFEEAYQEYLAVKPAAPKDPSAAPILGAYKQILEAATQKSAGEYNDLVKYMQTHRMVPEIYWEAAEAMRKVRAYETSERILNAGMAAYPFSRMLSSLRKQVLNEQKEAEFLSSQTVASVREEGYSNQKLNSDQLEKRIVGTGSQSSMTGSGVESLVNDEKLKGIEITEEDMRNSAK
ncbi:tetratricopeptide repeat protein [Cerasicoccus fimbriatus]|uniref:tetratricopeptide repeat protein n=1 Tax=Cerasicoccus fimbriatus TaxID=3014554 RepID=UPI0022B5D50E|nr:hypothetical protein [Cerasicoccus sp. TK19100]